MDDLQKVLGNRFLKAEEVTGDRRIEPIPSWDTFHQLEGGESFLDILLKVLDENNGLPFQEKIESLLRPVDFQKSIDDEDDEDDSREDRQIDRGETSFYLLFVAEQNTPPSLFVS